MALRWGIVGVGKISHDFVTSLKSTLTDGEHKIVAVASRNIERSKEFAEKYGISKYYSNYEDLARDDEVEVAYIAVLNPFHNELSLLLLKHGKHILCEKPFCMNSWQVKEVLDQAKFHKLFAMEGLWSRFFPVYSHLKNLIQSESLGKICEVHIKHGFKGDDTDRIVKKELGGGVVLDIGVYAIQFALFCFQDEPKSIITSGKTNADGVDVYFEAEIIFSEGRIAKVVCSSLEEYDNQAVVVASRGTIYIPKYWCPTTLVEPDGSVRTWLLTETKDAMNFTNSSGLRYEADEVRKCIRSGKLFSDIAPPKDSLLISSIQDEIRRQIGVRYDCDKF